MTSQRDTACRDTANYDEKNPSTTTCFSESRHEKAWSGKFGGDWKDTEKESEGSPLARRPETEVSG